MTQINNNYIYKITFKSSDLFYIGSAVDFKRRKRQHLFELANNCHSNIILQRLYNKYSEEQICFEVIDSCDNTESLLELEQSYIDKLKPTINICKVAGSRLGVKHSAEAIKKMKGRKMSDEQKESISKRLLGKKQSAELVEKRISKIRGSSHYLFGKHLSNATRNKMSANKAGKTSPNKGKKWDQLQKDKLSSLLKGKPAWNKGIAMKEATKEKLSIALSGEKSPRAKFSKEDILFIKKERENGVSVINIANDFNCDRSTIYSILKNKSYKRCQI